MGPAKDQKKNIYEGYQSPSTDYHHDRYNDLSGEVISGTSRHHCRIKRADGAIVVVSGETVSTVYPSGGVITKVAIAEGCYIVDVSSRPIDDF